MGFGGEGEHAARRKHTRGFSQHRREIGDIDHRVRGENDIRAGIPPRPQTLQHVGNFQLGVEAGGPGPLDHPRRQIDADEMIDRPGEGRRRQSGAAAEIDRAFEERRLARGRSHRQHRLEQQRRAAIAEIADQRGFKPRRILVEQGLHIGLRHAGHRLGAEPHQSKASAVAIAGIAGLGLLIRRDRRLMLAELFADAREREPGGCEIWRQLDRLQQKIGGCGQIALQLQVAREFEAAVGHQIAGGEKKAGRHFRNRFRHCRAGPGNPSTKGDSSKDGCAGQARA